MLAKAKHRAQAAVDSSLQIRKDITKKIADGLNSRVKRGEDGSSDDSDLRTTLFKHFAPDTKFRHSIVHSRISSDGKSITPEVHEATGYAKDHFNRFANLRVTSGDGITSYVKGHLKDKDGKELLLACLSKTFEDKTIIFVLQYGLKMYMKHKYNIELFRCPDEAYIIEYNTGRKVIKILEKKEQNVEGSVETKLWSGPSLKREYELVLGDNFEVYYGFCVSEFLKKKLTSNKKKYTNLF